MPEIGSKVDLEIEELAYRGPGVGRLDGMVVFTQRVAPGERVTVEITRKRRNFAEATLVEIQKPSPHRIESCTKLPDGSVQPGCCYDFLKYETEVEVKNQQLLGLLRHIPEIKDVTLAPFASPEDLNYRNKVVFHARKLDDEKATVGYYGDDNRTIIDIERCALAHPAINETWSKIRAEMQGKLENGDSVTLRWTQGEGVRTWINRPAEKAPYITERSPGGELKVPLRGFYQVNHAVADAMVKQVKEWVDEAANELGVHSLLDLYCGVGVFALNCAGDNTSSILGIDSVRSSVAAARVNSKEWGVNANFRCARVEDAARKRFSVDNLDKTLVIADPPRQGMAPNVIDTLAEGGAPHIFYVSCDPATLARDVKRLAPLGYKVRAARMFDMFPRTIHFETALWLAR